MPQFAPNEEKVAIATFPVKPAGLACTAELWLSRDGVTKDATSGEIPFTSTGVDQSVSLPIIMPSNGGLPYQVLIDPKAEGISLPGFRAIEDVVIAVEPAEISLVGLEFLTPVCYEGSVITRAVYYVPPDAGEVSVAVIIPAYTFPYQGQYVGGGFGWTYYFVLNSITVIAGTSPDNLYEAIQETRLVYRAYLPRGTSGVMFLPTGSWPLWLMVGVTETPQEQVGTLDVSSICTGHFTYDLTCFDEGPRPGSTIFVNKGMSCTITNVGSNPETHIVRVYHYSRMDDASYPTELQKPGAALLDEVEVTLNPGESTVLEAHGLAFNPNLISKCFYIIDDSCGRSAECRVAC